MEVGAVKQAFNNELILLKKNLNQAKIQTIHKLTRKAKMLNEKKTLDPLKEKFRKKAESAIKEVLIMKKMKSRDLGKFIVTHTGTLQHYLNRPEVDQDKACARLLLHKVLQDKYNFIRSRFTDVPIKDLFMSRLERRKMKKEAREKQKEKKKGKQRVGNAESDWDVEDAEIGDVSKVVSGDSDEEQSLDNEDMPDDGEKTSEDDGKVSEDERKVSEYEDKMVSDDEKGQHSENEIDLGSDIAQHEENEDSDRSVDSNELTNIGRFVKLSPAKSPPKAQKKTSQIKNVASNLDRKVENKFSKIEKKQNKTPKASKKKTTEINEEPPSAKVEHKLKIIEREIKNRQEKKPKDSNKNKKFNEKILQRKFKKDTNEASAGDNKIADPFFITSSGENYMSVAEPRQPDEVKEIHKQGNRKMRRAAMFGYVPTFTPTNYNHNSENPRFKKVNGFDQSANTFVKQNNRLNNNDSGRSNERSNFKDRTFTSKISNEGALKPEKLHPSWEAKKRQSGILPFQGKKIVFDEG